MRQPIAVNVFSFKVSRCVDPIASWIKSIRLQVDYSETDGVLIVDSTALLWLLNVFSTPSGHTRRVGDASISTANSKVTLCSIPSTMSNPLPLAAATLRTLVATFILPRLDYKAMVCCKTVFCPRISCQTVKS